MATTETVIRVRGTLKEIEALGNALSQSQPDATVGKPTPITAGLAARNSMGQLEWFDVLVHFGASFAAHAAYEMVRHAIKRLGKNGKTLEVQED